MVFHFDFVPANHCSEKKNTCFYEPINIGPDITKVCMLDKVSKNVSQLITNTPESIKTRNRRNIK